MRGEWIKWTKGLVNRPKILQLADKLGKSKYEAAALCMVLWEWCDEHLVPDLSGDYPASNRTCVHIDAHIVGVPGFSSALIDIGWLKETSDGVVFPKLGRHIGKSARERALDAKRKRDSRQNVLVSSDKRPVERPVERPVLNRTQTGLEKRRVLPPISPKGDSVDAARPNTGNPIVDPVRDNEGKPWADYFTSEAWKSLCASRHNVETYLRGGGNEADLARRACVYLARGYIRLGERKSPKTEADITETWWNQITSDAYPNARRAIAHGLAALWWLGQKYAADEAVQKFFALPETQRFCEERKAVRRA